MKFAGFRLPVKYEKTVALRRFLFIYIYRMAFDSFPPAKNVILLKSFLFFTVPNLLKLKELGDVAVNVVATTEERIVRGLGMIMHGIVVKGSYLHWLMISAT